MLATLELLPMWSGVDPDVELFASGDVAEEDDEWKGGHSLDGSTAPAPDAGQNLYGRSALVRSTIPLNMSACRWDRLWVL